MSNYPYRFVTGLVLTCGLALAASACGPTPPSNNCGSGQIECNGVCIDPTTDPNNCGVCDRICEPAAGQSCMDGECGVIPECNVGQSETCYSGLAGTENNLPCSSGNRICDADGRWGPCQGEVTPMPEICANGVDDDCNGTVDDDLDADGDGYTVCGGDCCDTAGTACANPVLVNPGAFEVDGNEVDDDCDGTVDNPLPACDSGLTSNASDGMQYAMAMDLCQTTTEQGDQWGVISATFSLADGSGTPAADAHSIRTGFGATATQAGDSMAVLSTGNAAAQTDSNPSFVAFQGGQDLGLSSGTPADWLAANGGNLPNAPGCPDPAGGTTASDPHMLTLRIRTPSNANSFSMSVNFFSSEYPEWVCSPYNDFFVVLLDSTFAGTPANPADKNLARYTAPDTSIYPVGVNLAFGNTGLFQQCMNGETGCGDGSVAGSVSTCLGTTELVGTGFDITNPPPQFTDDLGWCGTSNLAGGATGWLLTSGNVVPNEIIEIRLAIWDTGDPWYDSLVLLDNFQWSVEASEPGTVVVN